MKKLLVLLFSIFSYSGWTQTTIDDGSLVSGVWTKAASPYLISGSIMVPQGESLTIEPGVQVNFLGPYKFMIAGNLVAVGNPNDSIIFTPSDTAIGWMGIDFENADSNDSSFIKFCRIDHAITDGINGAGITIINSLKIAVTNCTITNCSSTGYGAAIYSTDSDPVISNNNISYNHSAAGAVFTNSGGVVDHNIVAFNDNIPVNSSGITLDTSYCGAGIVSFGPFGTYLHPPLYSSIVSNNIITNNSSGMNGGGITVIGDVLVSNNTITNNHAELNGGAIFCIDCNNILKNTITDNSASSGGGIHVLNHYEVDHDIENIDSNIIFNNSAVYGGGGLTVRNVWQVFVTHNWICNNKVTTQSSSSKGGGGILITKDIPNDSEHYDDFQFNDNIISNNNSINGGGILIKGPNQFALINNTITNNASSSKGGGVYFNSSSPDLYSNIIWGNTALATSGGNQIYLFNESSDPNFYNNDVQGGSSGFGKNGTFYLGKYQNNIDAKPGFINPTTASGNNYNGLVANWALSDTSKCLNSGFFGQFLISLLTSFPEANDINGNPRQVNCRIDMGAIENQVPIILPSSIGFMINDFDYNPWGDTTYVCWDPYILRGWSQNNFQTFSNYHWSTGDTTINISVSKNGWYKLRTTSTTGCNISDSTFLILKPTPDFIINKDTQCISGNNFVFIDSINVDTVNYLYKWNFGDGNTVGNNYYTSHTYTSSGLLTVKLNITGLNGCLDSLSKTILISGGNYNPFPDSLKICNDSTVLNAGAGLLSFVWNNGDTNQNLTARSDGWYKVAVVNTDNCNMEDSTFVLLKPKAGFSINADTQCIRTNNFIFTNTSLFDLGTISSRWNFGDGNFSDSNSSSHIYTSTGAFIVKLKITKSNGCQDSLSKTIFISGGNYNPLPDTLKICSDSVVLNAGSGFTSYLWSNGDSLQVSKVRSDGWNKVTVTNNYGCFMDDSIFISLKPKADFIIDNDTQCLNSNRFVLTNNSQTGLGSVTSRWYFGDGAGDSVNAGSSHTYNATGFYNIKLVVTKSNGCKDSLTKRIFVSQLTYNPFSDTLKVVTDSTVLDAGTGFSSYLWNNGKTTQSIVVNNNGWYKVSVQNSLGCTGIDSVYILFKKLKTLFIDKVEASCPGSVVSVSVRCRNFYNIVGMQGTIAWDTTKIRFSNISYDTVNLRLTSDQFNLSQTSKGYFTFSWFDNLLAGVSLPDSSKIITISFVTKQLSSSTQSSVSFSSSITTLEVDSVNLLTHTLVKVLDAAFANGYIKISGLPYDIYNSYSYCDSTVYNGHTYYQTTTVTDTLRNAIGCDSFYNHKYLMILKAPIYPAIQIYANKSSIIYGDSTLTFSTILTYGGYNPVLHWYKNGILVDNVYGPTYSPRILNANDTISAVLVSSFSCAVDSAISNKIVLPVSYIVSGQVSSIAGSYIPTVSLIADNISTGTFSSLYFSRTFSGGLPHSIRFNKINDVLKTNGVSTLDIALIQSHILDITKLDNPFKVLAADVDGNGYISALDILHIRRLILGITTTFPNNRLWRFVDSASVGLADSLPVKDSVYYDVLMSNKSNLRFIGVKLGDVNLDWNPLQARPANNVGVPVIFYHDDISVNKNTEIRIPFKVKNFKDLIALQYTLRFNPEVLQFKRIENNILNVQFADNRLSDGLLSFIWNDAKNKQNNLMDGTVIMELVFNEIADFGEESLDITSDITPIESWDGNLKEHDIIKGVGKIIGNPKVPTDKENWTVSPNPTTGVVNILVFSKENRNARFILKNSVGSVIAEYQQKLLKGQSVLQLNLLQTQPLAAGVYYMVSEGFETGTCRKIIIEK